MKDVDLALSQISSIRAQLAASTRFQGIAPELNLLMGIFVVIVAAVQGMQADMWAHDHRTFITVWAAVIGALFCVATVEAVIRARRLHGDMASAMLSAALQRVLPFAVAGTVITWVICSFAADSVWLLPGLWLLLIGLLGFAVLSSLPRQIVWVAGWYVFCGALVLGLAGSSGTLSPWMMGVPFGVGHIAVALVLNRSSGGNRVRA